MIFGLIEMNLNDGSSTVHIFFVYLQSFMKLFKIMIIADFICLKSTVAKRDVKWLYRTHKALISSEVRKKIQ